VEEEVIKMLAEGRIETNVYSPPGESSKKANVKENEQNVKNRAREKLFTEQIEECVPRCSVLTHELILVANL
jgi:kinetochore protein Mis13/DSN1